MPTAYKTIKNRFNSQTPKIKQIFCKHKFLVGREFNGKDYCFYLKCSKCGFFKRIDYFKGWAKMNKYIFPVSLIVLDIGAAIVYALNKDFKMMTYWVSAAVLNICVTF